MTQSLNKTKDQKILTHGQNSLARWAVNLHHTRRNGQSGFQSVTQLLGFTHQTHRKSNDSSYTNENNLQISSEIAFSSLRSVVLPIENRYVKYITFRNPVKSRYTHIF